MPPAWNPCSGSACPPWGEIQTYYVGPVIGAHCGPGTVAICFFGKERPC